MPIARFIVSPAGRGLRILAGGGLVVLGAVQDTQAARWSLIAVGLIPLLAGAGDICLFAPLFGGSLSGKDVREQTHAEGIFGLAA
jgi:hypothetical protein